MKLLTKLQLKQLPKRYGQEKEQDKTLYVKLFCPWNQWTWYIAEYDPEERIAFGYVEGFEKEWGYFSIPELEEIKGFLGLRIERDIHFKPKKFSELVK